MNKIIFSKLNGQQPGRSMHSIEKWSLSTAVPIRMSFGTLHIVFTFWTPQCTSTQPNSAIARAAARLAIMMLPFNPTNRPPKNFFTKNVRTGENKTSFNREIG